MDWEKSFDQHQERKNEKAKMRNGEQNTRDSRPSALHAMLKDSSHFQKLQTLHIISELFAQIKNCLYRNICRM